MDKLQNVIQMTDISKSFSGVEVLHGVDFDVRRGEVHALMGENGAGKSTLVKILMGELRKDKGKIVCDGTEVQINRPVDAHILGLSMIHQELSLIPDMSIADNIYAGREIRKGFLVNKTEQNRRTAGILASLNLELNPKTWIRELKTAQMQMVEIVKAVSFGARVIVMDEPTSSISQKETKILFEIIRKLREEGISFIYITHRMEEVFEIADRMTIMRDGNKVACDTMENFTRDSIIKLMVGRELKDYFPPHTETEKTIPLLSLEGLTRNGEFSDITLKVYPGEILGLAGLIGAGRTELASAIFGLTKLDKGTIKISKKEVTIRSPKQAVQHGLALIPEDRKIVGLNQIGSVEDNILSLVEQRYSWKGLLRKRLRKKIATDSIKKFSVKVHSERQLVGKLSGGNQQKVVLAKWLLNEPNILILDEPTRGIDVGSRTDIYHLIVDIAKQGKAVLLISSDMPEIIGMCDRVAVLAEGILTGILDKSEVTQERIMELASQISA